MDIKFFSFLKENIKNKFILTFIFVTSMLVAYKKYSPNDFKLFTAALVHTKIIVLSFWLPILCIILFTIIFIILLKESEKKYQDEWDKSFPRYMNYQNKKSSPITVRVIENKEFIDNSYVLIRSMSIRNTIYELIEHVKGKVIFYSGDTIVFEEMFNVNNLDGGIALKFYHEVIETKHHKWNWDRFSLLIESITVNQITKEKIKMLGITKLPNYNLILKRKYIGISKFKLPYEVTWLKRAVIETTINYIQHKYRRNRYYKNRGLSLTEYLEWKFRQLLVVGGVSICSLLFVSIFIVNTYVILKILMVWFDFFYTLITNLFS